MMQYIIQVILFQILFLGIYEIFLKKETFFQWNRFYLIFSSVLAYIIPFIQIEFFNNYVQNVIEIPTFYIDSFYTVPETDIVINSVKKTTYFTLENIYFFGLTVVSILFLVKLFQIYKKIKSNKILKKQSYKLVILENENVAFSFFKYIFLGKDIFKKDHKHILRHELIHVNQKHSLDLLFFEIQKIIIWFNPFSYLYSYKISILHEYIADEKTIKENHKKTFFKNLLIQTFHIEKLPFVNNYFKKSLLKKRIIMATKNNSNPFLKTKYLLIIPVLIVMFMLSSSFKNKMNYNTNSNYSFYILDTIVPPAPPMLSKVYEKEGILDVMKVDQPPRYENSKNENENKAMNFILETMNFGYKNINKDIVINANLTYDKPYYVTFIVDKKGEIKNVNTSEIEYINLKKEVIRVLKSLPKIEPAIHNGKKVSVNMVMAIPAYINKKQQTEKVEIPYSAIQKTPTFKECETYTTEKESKKCFTAKIQKHIAENFNVKLAKSLGLSVGRKKIAVQFVIDKNGEIVNIRARAPHPKLKEEAIRVIKKLPKIIPGENNNKKVRVRYNLPIVFNVEGDSKNNTNKISKDNSKKEKSLSLAGTIGGEFGYILCTKEFILNNVIAVLDFNTNKTFNIDSFEIVIANKKYSVKGNRITGKNLIKAIKNLDVKDRILIKSISVKDKSEIKILNINIKIKE